MPTSSHQYQKKVQTEKKPRKTLFLRLCALAFLVAALVYLDSVGRFDHIPMQSLPMLFIIFSLSLFLMYFISNEINSLLATGLLVTTLYVTFAVFNANLSHLSSKEAYQAIQNPPYSTCIKSKLKTYWKPDTLLTKNRSRTSISSLRRVD